MKKIFLILCIPFYILYANSLNISTEYTYDYNYKDYLFIDTNTTKSLSKNSNTVNFHIDGNYNEIIGFSYDKNDLTSSDTLDKLELYIGDERSKYVSYARINKDIKYGSRPTTQEIREYTFFNFYTLSKSKFSSTLKEDFSKKINGTDTNLSVTVHRKYNLEKNIFTTENFYNMAKVDAQKGKNYFYGVSVAKNFNSNYRVYGVAIISYEKWDYSDGEAYYYDSNGTREEVKDISDDDENKLIAVDGRFEGFGYGYKLTGEAYWDKLLVYATLYTKKTVLKNYHKGVKYKEANADAPKQVISKNKLEFNNTYLSLGIKYKF